MGREPEQDYWQEAVDAVEMTVLCKQLGTLPRAGGLKDQDSRDVWLMKHVLNYLDERAQLDENRRTSK